MIDEVDKWYVTYKHGLDGEEKIRSVYAGQKSDVEEVLKSEFPPIVAVELVIVKIDLDAHNNPVSYRRF
jgi:hypothetical protein